MSDQPWFTEGLQFTCSQCGDCCTGAPGYVWVNQAEIEALAALVGVGVDEFQRRYIRKVGIRRSLVEFSNGDCVFFDGRTRKCTVYAARPRQCRTWPFWDSNIKTPEAWRQTCHVCPGSGQGQLISVEQVLQQAAVIKL